MPCSTHTRQQKTERNMKDVKCPVSQSAGSLIQHSYREHLNVFEVLGVTSCSFSCWTVPRCSLLIFMFITCIRLSFLKNFGVLFCQMKLLVWVVRGSTCVYPSVPPSCLSPGSLSHPSAGATNNNSMSLLLFWAQWACKAEHVYPHVRRGASATDKTSSVFPCLKLSLRLWRGSCSGLHQITSTQT